MRKILMVMTLSLFTSLSFLQAGESADWRASVPVPVFEKEPGYVELYWKAWEIAHQKIKTQPGLPQSPYIDEAFWDDTIWIWDTCFMALFCKYAPDEFPGVESLNNFYVPLHDKRYNDGAYPLNIQHPDNPPLFAWVEYDNYTITGDRNHVIELLTKTKYLQKHFEWFDQMEPGWKMKSSAPQHKQSAPTALKKVKNGYLWDGVQSGMDNTPRKRGGLWIDAISQQALSALYISRLADASGCTEISAEWKEKYQELKKTINTLYWNAEDGIYYDLNPETYEPLKVKTPAAYWPMLAEICTPEQAERMREHIQNPAVFGGERPWVTVARDDPAFTLPDGDYWRGGIWLPTAYMGTKALEKYGFFKEADAAAENLLAHMFRTYKTYEPHTIWECYSPSRDTPANHGRRRVRPDFCGWSALGPISLFIENVMGFHQINALERKVDWRLYQTTKHGLKHLRFGGIDTDIIYNGKNAVVVTSNSEYTLVINGVARHIAAGETTIRIETDASPAGDILKAAPEK
ncbi:MAG TPA: trehalase family glycosidase [Pontiellaceae bacterium]|nr:trehalase family glycosidase [Pontiellaceae bacterium]